MKERWKKFEQSHPKLAKWVYQLFYFWVFSMSVTIFQYLAFTFLPYLWNILGYEVLKDAEGTVLIGGGLGYFLSYELGTFLAQCINFPLQRNITFHSKGKISWQIFWYFIAWLLISFVCNAVNGLWIPLAQIYFTPAVYNLLVTFITGGVSMVIYFFVFKIIFPEGEREHGK